MYTVDILKLKYCMYFFYLNYSVIDYVTNIQDEYLLSIFIYFFKSSSPGVPNHLKHYHYLWSINYVTGIGSISTPPIMLVFLQQQLE